MKAENELLKSRLGLSECVVCGEPGMGPLCDYHVVVVNNLDGAKGPSSKGGVDG